MAHRIRALTTEECDAIGEWRYVGRYATYEFDEGPPDPAEEFFAVEDDSGQLIGYCCFGAHARVPGVEAEAGVVDVGYGMRPDLVGQGRARPFVKAILMYASQRFDVERFRAMVVDWNGRSLAACHRAGFEKTGEVTTDAGTFVVLERPV